MDAISYIILPKGECIVQDVIKVRMTKAFVGQLFTRDSDGNKLAVEWGEPDEDEFYNPIFRVDFTDNPIAQLEAENERLKKLLFANVVEGTLDKDSNKILRCIRCGNTKRVGSALRLVHHPDCVEGQALGER